ncbi:SH3 domain-containing C40 family peptidase [Flintibacter muris]|uniref:C40 family peptidase n=1 Tax=Flintibacter muris TaxID=2941327 RepID=UPI00203C56D9|nr:SH3 domain-containing C40 family peptidase [Flintibacter muris]
MNLKRTITRLTASLLLAVSMVSPALAATGTVNTEGSSLRLRAQASTDSSVLTKLPHNSQVEVIDQPDAGWYHVSYKGTEGYVSADYLIVTEDVAAQPVPTSAEPAAQSDEPADAMYIKVLQGPLNIRTGPSTDYDRVGQLSVGRTAEVLDVLDGWYQIEAGYVCGDYVREVDAAEAQNSSKGQEIADYALQFLGYRYVYGGASPSGFDCSGFTSYVYKQFGYSLNRSASDQLDNGTPVSRGELQPGDLVIFKKGNSSKRATHVGLYIGNNQFIHASTSKVGVIISRMSDAYYTTGFVGGRRIV